MDVPELKCQHDNKAWTVLCWDVKTCIKGCSVYVVSFASLLQSLLSGEYLLVYLESHCKRTAACCSLKSQSVDQQTLRCSERCSLTEISALSQLQCFTLLLRWQLEQPTYSRSYQCCWPRIGPERNLCDFLSSIQHMVTPYSEGSHHEPLTWHILVKWVCICNRYDSIKMITAHDNSIICHLVNGC